MSSGIRLSTPNTNDSSLQKNSRYVQGGDVVQKKTMLGWLEIRNFPKHFTDVAITIRPEEDGRPDLLAYNIYGQTILMWFVLQYNNIVDITEEFVTGKTLILPTKKRLVMDLLTRQTKRLK